MNRDRLVAVLAAIACAYAGVASILTHHLDLVGPFAAGFVVCVFAAASLEEFLELDR